MRKLYIKLGIALVTFIMGISLTVIWSLNHFFLADEQVSTIPPIDINIPEQEASLVDFCELTKNPEQYHQQIIRIQAILIADESRKCVRLVLPTCDSNPNWVYAWDDLYHTITTWKINKRLDYFLGEKLEGKPIKAKVDMVGEFTAYGDTLVPHLRFFMWELKSAERTNVDVPKPCELDSFKGLKRSRCNFNIVLPNNSFNASGNRTAFIRKTGL